MMRSWGSFLVLCIALVACETAHDCAWSNEGCSEDEECCSKSCHRAHEGTNPRCRHSTLGEKCVFHYHCQDSLTCGRHYNCCSPYWKMCTKNSDCCELEHICRPAEGFLYDRCLFPSDGISVSASPLVLTITFIISAVAPVVSGFPDVRQALQLLLTLLENVHSEF